MARFFPGDHPELQTELEAHFARARQSAETQLTGHARALVLGGGYGRGEGGVRPGSDDHPERFFNDLDYFLFADQPASSRLQSWREHFEREESAALGIDVEVKLLPPGDVVRGLDTMMFTDLVHGHYVVWGEATFLDPEQIDSPPEALPLDEATRLLWNRGSGLYFARCEHERHGDPAFIERNLQKLKLALGDAELIRQGLYHPLAAERGRRMDSATARSEQLIRWHREGLSFKFQPAIPERGHEAVGEEIAQLTTAWRDVYLRLESERLNHAFTGLPDYAHTRLHLFPRHPRWRNLALAVRDRLKRGASLSPCIDYPRGALMRALALLLDGQPESSAAQFIPRLTDHAFDEEAYRYWWTCYS